MAVINRQKSERAAKAVDGRKIIEGLAVDEKVVASGQFLLDSEASLTGIEVRPLGGAK